MEMGRVINDKLVRQAFGRRLRTIRRSHGLTQQALADRASLTMNYVFRLEKGERNPTLLVLHDLAKALRVRVRELTDPG